jgi:hypothetical protein
MKVFGVSTKQRKLIIYENLPNDICKYYDGKTYHETTKETIHQWSFTKSFSSKFIPIKKTDDETFEDCFTEFVEKANTFRKLTLGLNKDGKSSLVNLYRTGSVTNTAKSLFYEYCNSQNIKTEPISFDESIFIKKSSSGALIYSNNVYIGPSYSYDINSFYPSIMRCDKFKIPIKAGVLKTLSVSEFDKFKNSFFPYGIYRCKITSEKPTKLFRFNKFNYYTTHDLRSAILLKLNIELVDVQNNFLYYPASSLISGKNLFRWFVDILFGLKKKDKRFKEILNCLWGSLVQEKKTRLILNLNESSDVDLNLDEVDIISQVIEKDKVVIEYMFKHKSSFKTDFGRLKPFLLSQGRLKLCNLLVDHVENIEKIHTDGFISSKELPLELGDGIGDLRFEGCKNIKIVNVNKVIEI